MSRLYSSTPDPEAHLSTRFFGPSTDAFDVVISQDANKLRNRIFDPPRSEIAPIELKFPFLLTIYLICRVSVLDQL